MIEKLTWHDATKKQPEEGRTMLLFVPSATVTVLM
jgi:hypothetical protein